MFDHLIWYLTTRFPWLLWEVCLGNVVKPQWLSCWQLRDLLATLDWEGETIINWWLHRQFKLVIFSFNFVISWWRLGDFQVSVVEKNQATPHLNKSKRELPWTNINLIWWLSVPGPPANQWLMLWCQRKIWSLRICQTTFQEHQNTLSWELKWSLPTMYGTFFSLASARYGYLVSFISFQ